MVQGSVTFLGFKAPDHGLSCLVIRDALSQVTQWPYVYIIQRHLLLAHAMFEIYATNLDLIDRS